MLPLIIRASQHQGILHPDTAPGKVESCVNKGSAEIQPLGVCVEHIGGTAFFQDSRHILHCRQEELIELFTLDGIVLNGKTIG